MAGSIREREHVAAVEALMESQSSAEELYDTDPREASIIERLGAITRERNRLDIEQMQLIGELRKLNAVEDKHHLTIRESLKTATWAVERWPFRQAAHGA